MFAQLKWNQLSQLSQATICSQESGLLHWQFTGITMFCALARFFGDDGDSGNGAIFPSSKH